MSVKDLFVEGSAPEALPIYVVSRASFDEALRGPLERWSAWIKSADFKAQSGKILLLPGEKGVGGVLFGLGADDDPLATATLSNALAAGIYRLALAPPVHTPDRIALAWAMGGYAFRKYKGDHGAKERARLAWPAGADQDNVLRIADGLYLARDLVNTPSNDMGPLELEKAVAEVANFYGAAIKVIVGDDLIAQNYPMIYTVGRGSNRAPRLIDVTWGDSENPRVTLVGKGVCFDSGGLDIKPSSGMAMMKKDMGGAAAVLGLAHMIMDAKLPVGLRVLIPAVENSISGDAYRPGDVLRSRKGITVEVGNTDAEGRLVLADALTEADSAAPELLICMATLTGAARVATGFDLPPFFTNDETLASDIMRHGETETDPLWRLPLWRGYRGLIEGKVADLTNNPDSPNAGAITAALFLERFVEKAKSFVHLDIAAWNDRAKPGRPLGGEAQAIRTLFALIKARYS
jgi:leucyl aminopeptidase